MKTVSLAILSTTLTPLALAGCPNGCSKQGTCGMYDMCTCYRGFQGSDCSERVCPYDYSFVTTPQGDLNFDGDNFDSYLKPIVGSKSKGTAARTTAPIHGGNQVILKGNMPLNDNVFTFDVSNAFSDNELVSGDSVLIDDEVFVITEVNSGAGTLKMSTRAKSDHQSSTGSQIFKFLEAPGQVGGAWEAWPGIANAKYDEAHFYMECSNKGMCDRSTGVCKCFDGYEGKACTRMKCPGEDSPCSGHGICQDVATLAWSSPTLATFQTKYNAAGSTTISITENVHGTAFAQNLPYIRFGRYMNETVKVTGIVDYGFTIQDPIDQPLEDFTEVYIVHDYRLWDAKKARTCTCDPGWTGHDCASRVCPKGDDPLTVTGTLTDTTTTTTTYSTYTQENEKQTITITNQASQATGSGQGVAVVGALGLTFTDQYGYAWDFSASHTTKLSIKAEILGTNDGFAFETPLPASEVEVGDIVTFDNYDFYTVTALNADTSDTAGAGYLTSITVSETVSGSSTYNNLYVAGFAKSIKAGLTGLPNSAVPSALVETRVSRWTTIATGQSVAAADSYRLRVDFTSQFNSGDLPPLGCNTSDLITAKHMAGVGVVAAGSTRIMTYDSKDHATAADYSAASYVTAGMEVLIGREFRIVTGVTTTSITVDRPFGISYDYEIIAIRHATDTFSTKISCSVTDEPLLVWGPAGSSTQTAISQVAEADDKTVTGILTTTTDYTDKANFLDSNDLRINTIVKAAKAGGAAGDSAAPTSAPTVAPTTAPTGHTVRRRRLLAADPADATGIANWGMHKYGPFEYRVVDSVSGGNTFTVSEAFGDLDDNKWANIWISEKGRTESVECSRRGSCDGETGQCTCFTGYTGAACQTQSALSF